MKATLKLPTGTYTLAPRHPWLANRYAPRAFEAPAALEVVFDQELQSCRLKAQDAEGTQVRTFSLQWEISGRSYMLYLMDAEHEVFVLPCGSIPYTLRAHGYELASGSFKVTPSDSHQVLSVELSFGSDSR
jgi:hypothetical protein